MIHDKTKIVTALSLALNEELAALERVAAMSRDEVGSDETRNEGKYDTRSTEASYLARGLAFRIADLRQVVAWFNLCREVPPQAMRQVQAGALLALEGSGEELLFMAPVGGGQVRVGAQTIKIISPSSPLGEALVGLEVGDCAEVETPRGMVTREVLGVW